MMPEVLAGRATVALEHGDMRQVLAALPDGSVDAVVTDPPYEIAMMGRSWDRSGVAFDPVTWTHCWRVLKPGGHLVAFGAARTYHRLASAIEDAGFEIRDQLLWLYGTGYPKGTDLAKLVAKLPDASLPAGTTREELLAAWEGWNTALKPAHEPICLARKPLSEGTVLSNLAAHGVGGLNIKANVVGEGGRFPANLIHDGSPDVVEIFPAEAGAQAPVHRRNADKFRNTYGAFAGNVDEAGSTYRGDAGSAARFFYCAKASPEDRGPGNDHPTVKPTELMRHLVRLVVPAGAVVLDPFMGSGSTGRAARLERCRFIGVDLEAPHVEIARRRVAEVEHAYQQQSFLE